MTGTADSLYFFVLFRSSTHGQIRLQKMAGDLQDPCFAGALCAGGFSLLATGCRLLGLLVLLAVLLVV